MKRHIFTILAAVTLLTTFSVVSSAQSNSKKLALVSGNVVTEKFTIAGGDGISYTMFGIKSGNLIKYSVGGLYTNGQDAQGLTIGLHKMGSEKALETTTPGEEKEFQFQASGDYEIIIMNPGRRSAKITLNFEFNPATSADSDVCAGCDNPTNTDEPERIQLAKGESDVDLDINLDARETKKYVAWVAKGMLTCILPNTDLGKKVTIRVNGKILDPNQSTCSARSTKAGDQVIEFTNNGNKEIPFMAAVGFHEH